MSGCLARMHVSQRHHTEHKCALLDFSHAGCPPTHHHTNRGPEAEDLLASARLHYQLFWSLREHFRDEGEQLFVLTAKAHSLIHVCKGSGRSLSPRFSWCYQAEDWMGKMRVLSHSCIFGARDLGTSRRMVDKYLVAVHWILMHPDSWFWRFQ